MHLQEFSNVYVRVDHLMDAIIIKQIEAYESQKKIEHLGIKIDVSFESHYRNHQICYKFVADQRLHSPHVSNYEFLDLHLC